MEELKSRKESISEKCVKAAQDGQWGIVEILYGSEIDKFEKQWNVQVTVIEQINEKLYSAAITWEKSFDNKTITPQQSQYISVWSDERPKSDSFGEGLVLETWRAIAQQGIPLGMDENDF